MYVPDHFREARPEVLHDAMRQIGFATLVTRNLEANHMPMLLDGNVLRGHVARANPVWKAGEGEALAIFLGPHAYVSPNWYPSKAADRQGGADLELHHGTCAGPIRWIHDADWLRAHVTRLSETHERRRADPWKVGDAPESYIETMLRGIVGFELEIARLDGKYKLTQNRDNGRPRSGARGV